jgi:Ca2+-binding EF-hand superfamily protein
MNLKSEELTKLAKLLFEKYDKNNNNYIEMNELKNLLQDTSKEIGIPFPTEEDVTQVMLDMDKNNDSKICLSEFVKLYKILHLMKTESKK